MPMPTASTVKVSAPNCLQLLHALVGDHHADQEAQHAHDQQRLDPDLEHLLHHGADAEAPRLTKASRKITMISPTKAHRLTICLKRSIRSRPSSSSQCERTSSTCRAGGASDMFACTTLNSSAWSFVGRLDLGLGGRRRAAGSRARPPCRAARRCWHRPRAARCRRARRGAPCRACWASPCMLNTVQVPPTSSTGAPPRST